MRKAGIILLILALGLAFMCGHQALSAEPDREAEVHWRDSLNGYLTNDLSTLPEMDAVVDSFMNFWSLRGVSMAVMRNDSLLYAHGYGKADATTPMTPGTTLRLASVSKLLTAIGIMRLQEKGLVYLDTPVFGPYGVLKRYDRYIKDDDYYLITVEHLLRHQAGFTSRGGDPVFSPYTSLDALLQKSGLNLYVQVNPEQETAGNELWLQIINQSDIEIQSFEYSCYKDGELCSSGGGTNADNYEITSVEGTLTITDRKAEDEEGSDKDVRYEITVVAKSGNFTYDGTEHEVSGVESTEFTINDVTYTVSGLEASAKGTEVGTYPVKISGTPVVTDADGNDLTKQFTVNTKEGTLTVVEKSVNPEGDIRYSNYSGDRVVWTKGSNAGCEFVFKRSVDDELTFGHFTGIDVESKAVDASNYTAVSGSVVITLKPEYLETLAVGDHLLTANFDDGNSVTVKFTIKEKSEEKKSDTTLNNKKADVTPETGDTVNVQLIFLVMVLSMCVIFALCNLRSKLDEKKRRR